MDSQQEFIYPIANSILSLTNKNLNKGLNIGQTNSTMSDSQFRRLNNSNVSNRSNNLAMNLSSKRKWDKVETQSKA